MTITITVDKNSEGNLTSNQFSERIETLLSSRGCSKAWLAKELGITRQALHHVLNHGKKPKFVSEIAILFNVTPRWLETGIGKAHIDSRNLLESIPLYRLPDVISSRALSDAPVIDKMLFNRQGEDKHFAIIFSQYPSMSTKFDENEILIFNRNLKPQNGNYILADVKKEGIVFRQFYEEKKTILLKPSDSEFDSLKCAHCDILGTLVETRVKF